jgi:hypothetical protein
MPVRVAAGAELEGTVVCAAAGNAMMAATMAAAKLVCNECDIWNPLDLLSQRRWSGQPFHHHQRRQATAGPVSEQACPDGTHNQAMATPRSITCWTNLAKTGNLNAAACRRGRPGSAVHGLE